jgi:hypothetical protein
MAIEKDGAFSRAYILVCMLSVVSFVFFCFSAAARCENATPCRLQVMGHIFPGSFMYVLAYTWKFPEYRFAECCGMIAFWLIYWVIDFIQHGGVNFQELKIVQHYMFTMFVGAVGAFRLFPPNKSLDTFAMFSIVLGFATFVLRHPQPNSIGVWMHGLTAVWLFMFWLAYAFKTMASGTASLIMAATTFVMSQLSLTTLASHHMDVVAYFSCTTIIGLVIVSVFAQTSLKGIKQ